MIDLDKYEGHTPGPWMLLPSGEDACGEPHAFDYVEVAHRRYVSVEGRSMDEANINARLIADAPKLLAEVKRLRAHLAEAAELLLKASAEMTASGWAACDGVHSDIIDATAKLGAPDAPA